MLLAGKRAIGLFEDRYSVAYHQIPIAEKDIPETAVIPVIRRGDKTITLRRPKYEDIVSIDRVKPAHHKEPPTINKFYERFQDALSMSKFASTKH